MNRNKKAKNVEPEELYNKKDTFKLNFYHEQFQNESKGTSHWRPQPATGRGGAPKFFLNWLTFAL